MKKIYFLLSLLIVSTCLIGLQSQFSYHAHATEKYGDYGLLNHSISGYYQDYLIENTISYKAMRNASNDQENYLKNIYHQKVSLYKHAEKFDLHLFGEASLSNLSRPSHISGLAGKYTYNKAAGFGGRYEFRHKLYELTAYVHYHADRYRLYDDNFVADEARELPEGDLDNQENSDNEKPEKNITNAYLYSRLKIELMPAWLIKPFIKLKNYDDYNSSDIFDYGDVAFGVLYDDKIKNHGHLEASWQVGYVGYDPGIPWYSSFDFRWTSLYYTCYLFTLHTRGAGWMNKGKNKFFTGKFFTEGVFQYTFSRKANRTDKLLATIKHHYYDVTELKTALCYNIHDFAVDAGVRYFIGNQTQQKVTYSAGLNVYLAYDILLSGEYEYAKSKDSSLNKSVIIGLEWLY